MTSGGTKLAGTTAVRRNVGLAINRARTKMAQRSGLINSTAGERQHLIGSGISSKPAGHGIQTIGETAAKKIKVNAKKILAKKPKYQKIGDSPGLLANHRSARAQMRGDGLTPGGKSVAGGKGVGERFDNALDHIQTVGDMVQTYRDVFRGRKSGSAGGEGEEATTYDEDIINDGSSYETSYGAIGEEAVAKETPAEPQSVVEYGDYWDEKESLGNTSRSVGRQKKIMGVQKKKKTCKRIMKIKNQPKKQFVKNEADNFSRG